MRRNTTTAVVAANVVAFALRAADALVANAAGTAVFVNAALLGASPVAADAAFLIAGVGVAPAVVALAAWPAIFMEAALGAIGTLVCRHERVDAAASLFLVLAAQAEPAMAEPAGILKLFLALPVVAAFTPMEQKWPPLPSSQQR